MDESGTPYTCNVSFINIETDFFDNSFPRLRFFPTPVWMLARFSDNRSSVGRQDPVKFFGAAGFGKIFSAGWRDWGKYFQTKFSK